MPFTAPWLSCIDLGARCSTERRKKGRERLDALESDQQLGIGDKGQATAESVSGAVLLYNQTVHGVSGIWCAKRTKWPLLGRSECMD